MKAVRLIFWTAVGAVACAAFLLAVAGLILLWLPNVSSIEGCLTTSMFHVDLCPGGKHYVALEDISPLVGKAVIASEDTSFYSHHGFDWYEIEQSFKANLEKKQIHRGGSTLTQQLAKNVWLSKERSYWRKAKEAYLTYELEKKFPKDFILEKYLNVVQFGVELYGVKDAAQFYFHKSPAQLHLLEATFLAFLLPNPDVYSKSFTRGHLTPFAEKIIGIILKRMVQFKTITPGEYQFAINQIGTFPWSSITQADFENARNLPATATFESPQDTEQLDDFLNDSANGEENLNAAPRPSEPKPAVNKASPPPAEKLEPKKTEIQTEESPSEPTDEEDEGQD